MRSRITASFRKTFRRLPAEVRDQAQRCYRLWKSEPYHNSLFFKQVHPVDPIYSVRVGGGWRALGLKDGDMIQRYWIGSHADYDDKNDKTG